ncbi:YmiA family putative membrane protein [Escherichia coli]|uniref:YmiA family putative membrane protein n=1 Tax=Escherichia coli TaxID=562 RepID=UPI001BCD825F|nr:YmiA family putative membrane protein [Escherichia coli]
MRLAMPSGNQEPRRNPELKRKAWLAKAWLAVFLGSVLFWVVVALFIWKLWG